MRERNKRVALTLKELAQKVGGEVVGSGEVRIAGVSTLLNAAPDRISFLANPSYKRHLRDTKAGAVIANRDDADDSPVPVLVSQNPYLTYARVAALLYPEPSVPAGVHPSAVVADDAQLGAGVWIGPHAVIESGAVIDAGCFVGPGCVIGAGTRIGANGRLVANVTVLHDCVIGQRALFHPGVVIGADGFGIANDRGTWIKVPQVGRVVIGDDVELGANTTVDRGAIEDTVIHDGVKIDNQVQIAHNVQIGAHTAIAGCAGVAGSAKIGSHCAIAGGVGIAGHLEIVDGVQVTAMALVTKSITEPGVYSSGTPLQPNNEWHRNFVRFRKLDEMARRLRALEKKINGE